MPAQPRQQVLHLRELDLELALAARRVQREDVEDERRAVDDLRLGNGVLEVGLLRRREVVVEDDERRVEFPDELARSPRPCPCR